MFVHFDYGKLVKKQTEFQLEILLFKLVQDQHEQQIFDFYEPLFDQGRKGELTATLEAYFREGGAILYSLSQCFLKIKRLQ